MGLSLILRHLACSRFHLYCGENETYEQQMKGGRQRKMGDKIFLGKQEKGNCKSRHLTGRLAPLTGTDTLHYPCRIVCAHIFMVQVQASVCDSGA